MRARTLGRRSSRMRHIFESYHPFVIFVYLTVAMVCAMLTTQPAFVILSFLCASAYAVYLTSLRTYARAVRHAGLLGLAVALINPLLNHKGLTVLFIWADNPITLESLLYGCCTAAMLMSVWIWCICWNQLMTAERFLHVCGRVLPTAALLLSIVMRMVPQARYKAQAIAQAQKAMGLGIGQVKGKERIRRGARTATVLMALSLENSMDTADAMKCRGYGAGVKRTSFTPFRFRVRDGVLLGMLTFLAGVSVTGICLGMQTASFYPLIETAKISPLFYGAYAAYLSMPLLLQAKEEWAWKRSSWKA